MDRILVAPYQIPTDLMFLNTNKNAMVGLGYALQAILGGSTLVDGLACTPTSPASMTVNVATGSIYQLAQIDSTAYGNLGSDTTDQIVKQGIVLGTTNFACPAPATTGQSVVYLIQAQFQEQDTDPENVQYYNAANPASPVTNNVNTMRRGVCVLGLKTGTPATTGSQTTSTPDAGYTALWAITVANGQTTITSSSIAAVSDAPFINEKLTAKISEATGDARYLLIGSAVKSVKIQFFNANGTYTPSPGLVGGMYFLFGGGGGGGGCYTTTSTTGSVGAGGGGGGLAYGILTAAQIGASQALTIGAGGTAGPINGSGGTGGTSSLGALMTATGGLGGGFIAATTGNGGPGGLGGSGTGPAGILSTNGPSGGSAFTIYGGSGGFFSLSGKGADSLFGTGGAAVTAGSPSGAPGNPGVGFGAGGSGAAGTNYGASGFVGGSGSVGGFVAIEFCNQ